MNAKVISYEASLDQEYETLTKKHETIKSQLEKALSQYLKEGKGKPVTIQGPYGSGKTQLLYHLFKFTWENGSVGIYTHLEKIIPSQEMGPSHYADYLKELRDKEVALLRKGESKLMSGRVRDYAINCIKKISSDDNPVVFFIDEIEQSYNRPSTGEGRYLLKQVPTSDNSPMKEVLRGVERGDAGFYLVLAFTPVSFYEFSKGEAQTRSFLSIISPIVEAKSFRQAFGEVGNLMWWMGKGRYGWGSKIYDTFEANIPDIKDISKKELQDLCNNIGKIGNVWALDPDAIEKIDVFENFRDFLIYLAPNESGGEIYSGTLKIVRKCRLYNGEKHNLNDIIEKSLRSSGTSKVTDIGYYLSIILDALSTSDGKVPLFTDSDDWKELLKIVEDIILEFKGEDRLASEDLRRLQDSVSDFFLTIHQNAQSTGLKEGYCIAPVFLHTLSPFPISSPNLTNQKIRVLRENLGDQTYLGKEEHNGISVFFFLNADKIKKYLIQESKSFLKETKALVVINLGGEKEIKKPKLAQWLEKEGRLKVILPTRILSDFLVSFFYWIRNEREESLPITSLSEKLIENQSIPEKDKARKIAYYRSRISEYLDSELPKFPLSKYILRDKTGFDEFKTGRVGFVPEVVGFSFVDSKHDLEALHKFRNDFEHTQFVSKESSEKRTGLSSALEKLVVEDRKTKNIVKGAVLRRISDSLGKYLLGLAEVVDETSKDEFATTPADDDSKRIFEGIYLYLKEWKDPSKAEEKFRKIKSDWGYFINRINRLSGEINEFEKLADKNVRLTHSLEADKTKIASIGKNLGNYHTKISPYTKFLLSTFIEKTIGVVEPKLNEIEKRFEEFQDGVKDKIEEYKSAFKSVSIFEKNTFLWINKSKDEIRKEFQEKFGNVCQDFTRGGKIDLENVPDSHSFIEDIKEVTDELQTLGEINESVEQCKIKAKGINKKLREWEAG